MNKRRCSPIQRVTLWGVLPLLIKRIILSFAYMKELETLQELWGLIVCWNTMKYNANHQMASLPFWKNNYKRIFIMVLYKLSLYIGSYFMVPQIASCLIILHVWHQKPHAENDTAIKSCKWGTKGPITQCKSSHATNCSQNPLMFKCLEAFHLFLIDKVYTAHICHMVCWCKTAHFKLHSKPVIHEGRATTGP